MKYIILFCLLTAQIFSQSSNNIQDYYNDILKINIEVIPENNHIVTSFLINKLDVKCPFAELVNNNSLLFDYMFQNNLVVSNETLSNLLKDTVTFRRNYIDLLKKSNDFNKTMNSIADKYLALKDKSKHSLNNEKKYKKADVLNAAVRFFFPFAVINSQLQIHICVGINGMSDFEFKRDLVMEGFVFQAIFENLDNKTFRIREDLEAAKKLAAGLGLSGDKNTKLNRAQGVVWGAMYKSKGLWKVITNSYKNRKNILPFRIEGI